MTQIYRPDQLVSADEAYERICALTNQTYEPQALGRKISYVRADLDDCLLQMGLRTHRIISNFLRNRFETRLPRHVSLPDDIQRDFTSQCERISKTEVPTCFSPRDCFLEVVTQDDERQLVDEFEKYWHQKFSSPHQVCMEKPQIGVVDFFHAVVNSTRLRFSVLTARSESSEKIDEFDLRPATEDNLRGYGFPPGPLYMKPSRSMFSEMEFKKFHFATHGPKSGGFPLVYFEDKPDILCLYYEEMKKLGADYVLPILVRGSISGTKPIPKNALVIKDFKLNKYASLAKYLDKKTIQ